MLVDSYSRSFKYLRLSLTEKCNFRCSYCLPNGFQGRVGPGYLSISEIKVLAKSLKALGVEKIRLTGGEPTLRTDLIDVISVLKNEVGIESVALTTNGFRLEAMLKDLKQAGLDAINISLDSLNATLFKTICGFDKCESIKRAVDLAGELQFSSVKTNAVLLKGLNDQEIFDFLEWVKPRRVTARFIELMRTGDNQDYFLKHHSSVDALKHQLEALNWHLVPRNSTSGPASEFMHGESVGRIGIIAPYSKDFCSSCNRLRVSATGGLRLCLFGHGELALRDLLQDEKNLSELNHRICASLGMKTQGHRLHENSFGNMRSLSAIGG